ncbi:hypothetical protein ACHAQK_006908 [Fusarium lateritium]
MDIFTKLPPELLTPILKNLPDLESLYNIVKASPHVFQFLNSPSGAAVLDSLLDHWGQGIEDEDLYIEDGEGNRRRREFGTLPWVPLILRLIALVRHCSATNPPADSLESLIGKYLEPVTIKSSGTHTHDLGFPSDSTPRIRLEDVTDEPQSYSPRKMLFLIRKIIVLSEECLQFFHNRIRNSKPQHLTDRAFKLKPLPWNLRLDGQPWGEPYDINAGADKPSWWELQGLIFGFCNLQLRYELSNAIYEGRLDWAASDTEAIRDLGSAEMCSPELGKWTVLNTFESIWAAVLYVQAQEGVPDEPSCVGDTDGENKHKLFKDTGIKPLEGGGLRLPQPKYETPEFKWPIKVSPQPLLSPWDNVFATACGFALGINGGSYAEHQFCSGSTSELTEGLLFRPFRRLGFGIWDPIRLHKMQMIDEPFDGSDPEVGLKHNVLKEWRSNLVFTWMSLLSVEEKGKLQAYQEGLRLKRKQDSEELSTDDS